MITRMLSVLTATFMLQTVGADVIVIQQEGLSYNPSTVTAQPGDTIRWVRNGGNHDVVHGLPCNAYDPPIFERMLLNSSNLVAEWVVPNAVYGEIPYFCSISDHCDRGMVGTINVVPPDNSFIPTSTSRESGTSPRTSPSPPATPCAGPGTTAATP